MRYQVLGTTPTYLPEHVVLVVGGGGARVDGVLAERAELRLEHEEVGLDRGGDL